jgi:prepilin-type processing-associated H-X9-DG protein
MDLNKGSANPVLVDGHVDSITAKEQENGESFKLAWPK